MDEYIWKLGPISFLRAGATDASLVSDLQALGYARERDARSTAYPS